jgi:diacylglycerol kinase family enzyme
VSSVIILNVRSGRQHKTKMARELRSLIQRTGADCDLVLARGGKRVVEAAQRLARSSYHTIIAAGGDGTINAVASELVGTGKRLGVLPLGTFNYFARELGLPMDLEEALRVCLEPHTTSITVGDVNGRMFLNNASIGLYPIILSVREHTYRTLGRSRLAAYWSVVRAMARPRINMRLTITTNGDVRWFDTPMVFVARNAHQLAEFQVPGIGSVDNEGFSVFVLPRTGKLGLLRLAWRALTRRLEASIDFELICTDTLRIDSARILRQIAFDGERARMLTPLHFKTRRQALQVAVPLRQDREAAA